MTLRLTFSKPVITRYFDGEEHVSFRVKIDDGVVHFLPVTDDRKGRDVLNVEIRKRGGGEAVIEGKLKDDLRQALTNPSGPFFTLRRQQGGWLTAIPWPRNEAPPKPEPHLRVWVSSSEDRTHQPTVDNLPALVALVRDARAVVSKFEASKRPGRPPREVLEARDNLVMFDRLVAELNPPKPSSDTILVGQAIDLLTRALGRAVPAGDSEEPPRADEAPAPPVQQARRKPAQNAARRDPPRGRAKQGELQTAAV